MQEINKELKDKELKELSDIVHKSKKSSRYISIISVLAILIGLTVSITSIFHLTNQQIEATDSLKTNSILIDSLLETKDSLTFQMSRKDSIVKFVTEFLTVIKSDSTVGKYYAVRVQKYYLRTDVRLNQIKQEKKWFIQDHPRSKVTFNSSDINVNLKKDKTSEIFVNALYYSDTLGKPQEIIYQIKLNQDNKVFFIRNLEPETKKK